MDVFLTDGLQHDCIGVLLCGGGQVETVMLVQMINEEGVHFSSRTLSTRGKRHILAHGHCHTLRIASANTMNLVDVIS